MGLAYSVFSLYSAGLNAVIVGAGVANNKIDQAYEAILDSLDKIVRGDFDDKVLTSGKNGLISDLVQVGDSLAALYNDGFTSMISGDGRSRASRVYEIENIEKDTICKTAKQLRERVRYTLKGR